MSVNPPFVKGGRGDLCNCLKSPLIPLYGRGKPNAYVELTLNQYVCKSPFCKGGQGGFYATA